MGEWDFLGKLFESLQAQSTMLGRFWLLLMLVFRILILGTVASDLFEDEQEEFTCNTLQPGCKQGCYDEAFPISQYRFWVFHIVLIATPSLVFLMYVMHHHNKRESQDSSQDYKEVDLPLRRLYLVNVAFRILAEVVFLVGQWKLYGFKVEARFPCSRFPCPYTVDCFTSRPMEKTVFLCFYFIVGVISAISSCAELFYSSLKWFCSNPPPYTPEPTSICQNQLDLKHLEAEENPGSRTAEDSTSSGVRPKGGSVRSDGSRKISSVGHKSQGGKHVSPRPFLV